MLGLVNRSIQGFVTETSGPAVWQAVAAATPRGIEDYESLSDYPASETADLVRIASRVLGKPRERLLEDLGTWLVTSPRVSVVRRLLRFGGTDYVEFLHSLDELPGRARMAVAGLDLPALELCEHAPFTYSLALGRGLPGIGHVLQGALQAMADDYGALAVIEMTREGRGRAMLLIRLFQTDYAEGRDFALAADPR